MISRRSPRTLALALLLCFAAMPVSLAWSAAGPAAFPNPTVDDTLANGKGTKTAVFSGGCFWGIEAVYRHVKGVTASVSGYAGGAANTAEYETVSTGRTGHAETVQVTYDPSQISYGQLLKIFFSVAHDPTEVNRQGPDVGTQYRSAVWFADEDQQKIAAAYIDQLNKAKIFSKPIATQVNKLQGFYRAEDYHQNYLAGHMDQPYIVFNDLPKLDHLKQQFPDLYRK